MPGSILVGSKSVTAAIATECLMLAFALGGVAVAGESSPPSAKVLFAESDCQPGSYKDWLHDCKVMFASGLVNSSPGANWELFAIIFDGSSIQAGVAMSLSAYHEVFTDTPSTVFKIGGSPYVWDKFFVTESLPVILRIGESQFHLTRDQSSWRVDPTDTDAALLALSNSARATVSYNGWNGQTSSTIPTYGFVEARVKFGAL